MRILSKSIILALVKAMSISMEHLYTMENGKMINEMEMELNLKMVFLSIVVNGRMVSMKVKENCIVQDH